MRAAKLRMALLCCVATALALPAAAGAKPSYEVKPKSLQLNLRLPASNGYSASLVTSGHRQVVLRISRGDFFATYTALGKISHKGIEVDFGQFGHASLRFRAKDRQSKRSRCKGRGTVVERGYFVGSVRFQGEREYTQVHAHRLKGTSVRSYRRICKTRGRAFASATKSEDEFQILGAQAKAAGKSTFFLAVDLSILGFALEFAGQKEKVEDVMVSKGALVFGGLRDLTISPRGTNPVKAKASPPKPFSGTGTYLAEGRKPPVWSGSLGLRLPGSGLVPLTGPDFEAFLCRASDLPEIERCNRELDAFEPFYGSGSHSQPLALARLSSLR